jgi:hypothetical protein
MQAASIATALDTLTMWPSPNTSQPPACGTEYAKCPYQLIALLTALCQLLPMPKDIHSLQDT